METFVLIVRKLRPSPTWDDVAAAVARETGRSWTVKQLRRTVKRLVVQRLGDRDLIEGAKPARRRRTEELAAMVGGMRPMEPDISLRGIGKQLETGVKTPMGHTSWSPGSVTRLLAKKFSSYPSFLPRGSARSVLVQGRCFCSISKVQRPKRRQAISLLSE
jgi:hypothetical protein